MSRSGHLLLAAGCIAGLALLAVVASGESETPRFEPPIRDPWMTSIPSRIEPAPPRQLDLLVLGEGYVASDETRRFRADVDYLARGILATEPFTRFKERIRVRSRFLASRQRGCDSTSEEDKVDTALDCRFEKPNDRVIDFGDRQKARRAVIGAGAADIVLVLVNTSRYGGAAVTLPPTQLGELPLRVAIVTTHARHMVDTALHEIGHCFAGLADEYEEQCRREVVPVPRGRSDLPWSNVSLWRCVDDQSYDSLAATAKWRHFLELPGARDHAWFHRGGYYHESGVVRPWPRCRMRQDSIEADGAFCPVCDEEIAKAITRRLGERWDDAEWHRQRPLSDWR